MQQAQKRNIYRKFYSDNLIGTEQTHVTRRNILEDATKHIWNICIMRIWTRFTWLTIGYSEHSNELLGPLKGMEFLA
jgi:hypothetical protein